jgi:putative cardiolipin synthase
MQAVDFQSFFSHSIISSLVHLWSTPVLNSKESSQGLVDFYAAFSSGTKFLASDPFQKKSVRKLFKWMSRESNPATADVPFQARTLHHDFMNQMRKNDLFHQKSLEERSSYLQDSIIEAVIRSLKQVPVSSPVIIYTFATTFHPRFKTALIEGIRDRHLRVKIFTNSIESYQAQAKKGLGLNEPVGYYVSLGDLDDLMQAGADAYILVNQEPYPYLHRKLAIVGDHVFFGSHNLTIASTAVQEELNFEMINSDLAAQLVSEFGSLILKFAMPLSPDTVHSERISYKSSFKQWLYQDAKFLY